jgi:hypothetical protein
MHPVSAERMHYLWGFPFACSLVQTHTPPCQWHTKEIQLHIQVQKASQTTSQKCMQSTLNELNFKQYNQQTIKQHTRNLKKVMMASLKLQQALSKRASNRSRT